jgi:hypothetical protein
VLGNQETQQYRVRALGYENQSMRRGARLEQIVILIGGPVGGST